MWKCKDCGDEMVLVEVDGVRKKYKIDKNKEKVMFIGESKTEPNYVYECKNKKCPNIAFDDEDLEEAAEWVGE